MKFLQYRFTTALRAGLAHSDTQSKGMHVLVTGGAGFLGSNLTRRLLQDGCHVTVLDDLSTGQRSNLPESERLELVQQCVTLPWTGKIDRIYHLACPASPPKYQADPVKTLRTCFLGTENMLQLARDNQAPLLFTSTSEVYGDPAVSPQPESYWGNVNSFGVRSCYDEGKRVAESLCYAYALHHGVVVRIARIFNTYGPHMDRDDGRVVSNFINQALQGKPLTVYGEGTQTRSLCYVDDLIEGLLRLVKAPGEPLEHPVNLGNPTELTMLQLAETIRRMVGSNSALEHHPLPGDDPTQRRPDIRRAKEWLDWEPTVGLEEGLRRTCNYFQAIASS
jgi:UDP-glucuronate decarboxylase